MNTLLMRLAGPLQAWGSSSRFAYRKTEVAPTKSGVIGMLAAARGLRRTDPLTELLGLTFGVRIDQQGELLRDFQTARSLDGALKMPLTYRFYLADAVFLVGVSGNVELLHGLHEALRRPHFPLYLGRRSCPPSLPISLGVHDGDVETLLHTWPWQASAWKRRRASSPVRLEILRDAYDGETTFESIRDEPVSFDPERRQHGFRSVVRAFTRIDNPDATSTAGREHDPFALLGG